jgi:hypothetical protein
MSTWTTDARLFDVLAGLEGSDGSFIPYEELINRSVIRGAHSTIRAASSTTSSLPRSGPTGQRTMSRCQTFVPSGMLL